MRILVTGGRGFVGRHLVKALRSRLQDAATVVPASRQAGRDPALGPCERIDLTDPASIERILADFAPTHVVHLAGASSPLLAKEHPIDVWATNVMGTLRLAHAILRKLPATRLVLASSGLVYGTADTPWRAFDERSPLAPAHDYAATKAAADLGLGALALQGLKVVRLRLFNHTGPGQSEAFVVPSFAAQVARIEAGLQAPTISVGSLSGVRDFLDVRDVVEAYVEVLLHPEAVPGGAVRNIASGVPWRIGAILDELLELSSVPIAVRAEAARMAASEATYSIGNASAARQLLGWVPVHDFKTTLADVLAYWRQQVAATRTPAREAVSA
jgi:GDP-4-dehydro-6-deoxy-D-mannose reductase